MEGTLIAMQLKHKARDSEKACEEFPIPTVRPSLSKGSASASEAEAEGALRAACAADVCSPASVGYMSVTSSCRFMARA